jgi:hypothetical protein
MIVEKIRIIFQLALAMIVLTSLLLATQGTEAASAVKLVTGWGTGTFFCRNGLIYNHGQIHFEANSIEGKKGITGNWTISIINTHAKFSEIGSIDFGKISNSRSVILVGKEQLDSLCKDQILGSNTDITIVGQCGANVNVTLTALNQQKGDFVGNVLCNKLEK